MAINAAMVWRVRVSGIATNGGGYDSTVSGAGTDYTDQDSPQLSITDLTTTGANATVISAAAGFTSVMVGNVIRIASGTNFTAGYYVIITFTSSTTVVLDRTCATGVGASGVAKVGGAFPKINQFANGGTGTQPTLTTPLAAGHTVYVRGSGSNDGATDYSHVDGYLQFPSGDTTNGLITFVGYNGRPCLVTNQALIMYNMTGVRIQNLKFATTGVAALAQYGMVNGGGGRCSVNSCIFDQAGNDQPGTVQVFDISNCWFKNTEVGSPTAGAFYAVDLSTGASPLSMVGTVIDGWRGGGITTGASMTNIVLLGNIIANCHGNGLPGVLLPQNTADYKNNIVGNTFYNNSSDGVKFSGGASILPGTRLINNIFSGNGGYGVNFNFGSAALNTRTTLIPSDYNCLYSNASGTYNNMTAGPHDVTTNPTFTNAASGDWSIGANMKSIGFPGVLTNATTTSYVDLGAAQSSGGSAFVGGTNVVLGGG